MRRVYGMDILTRCRECPSDAAVIMMEKPEAESILQVPEQSGGNRTRATRSLGIDRVSVRRRIGKYGSRA